MHLLKVQVGGVSYLCPGSCVYRYFVDRYFEDLIFLPLSCFDLTGTQGHLHLPSPPSLCLIQRLGCYGLNVYAMYSVHCSLCDVQFTYTMWYAAHIV